MSYDSSTVEEKYKRCQQAVELLKIQTNNDTDALAEVFHALSDCQSFGADLWNVSQLRLAIIETDAKLAYNKETGEFNPNEKVIALFD